MLKRFIGVFLIIFTFFGFASAQHSARVYSKHESIHEQNISRPRIYIENTGMAPLQDFYYYYYFTAENGKIPVVENYYVPNCNVTLENLGDNEFRVKYSYAGANLEPGGVLPDNQGNVVGLRYSDWSAWDKTNDYSFDSSSAFRLNGKIPVYLADGTQISGSEVPNPETPPRPPELKFSTAQYAVYSTDYTDLRDNSAVRGGLVGSRTYVEAGSGAQVKGGLLSGGDIFLRERANIDGDAAASQTIIKQNNTVITGTERSFAEITFPEITRYEVTHGTQDITIGPNGTGAINPGSYRNIHIFANSTVTLKTGVYHVDKFITEPDVKVIFEPASGKKTDIRAKSDFRIGDRMEFQFSGDVKPLSISIYSAQTSQLRIGTDAVVYGQITAPDAGIVVSSRTNVYGILTGKQVVIEPQSAVCKPATLSDFWHSEWAYARGFDPLVFEYKAIVPDATRTLQIIPYAPQGAQVTVNGNAYTGDSGVTVNLNNMSTNIFIGVSDTVNCNIGKTEYVVNVQSSPDYQIFVNENSPAQPNAEDGKSWQNAYKCLQKAIDEAGKTGKEIWVAEGTYYPISRTDPANPRTATFLINPGIEIIGGFIGNETEREPKGSPYKTILSGDLAKNDGNAWPTPRENQTDNAYHVVTMEGNAEIGEVKLEMLTITGGVADGIGENSNGAGILNKNCAPTLKYVVISKNMAASSGAGIMDKGGIKKLERCLIQKNISIQSGGAGIHTTKGQPFIDASVFDGNIVQDTLSNTGGAAMYVKGTKVNILNSVFTRNESEKNGGAIYSDSGKIFIENSTFASNTAASGQSIKNEKGSLTIINSILWNYWGKFEITGDAASINYTCIVGGYQGINNINQNPNFVNSDLPEGNDGIYGTEDDGLQLSSNSPCINAGAESNVEYDIRLIPRPQGDKIDLGAYEYSTYASNGAYLGIVNKNGEFVEIQGFDVLPFIINAADIPLFANSNIGRVMRVTVPKNKYTQNRQSGYLYVRWKNEDGSYLNGASEVKIYMRKIDEDKNNLYFQSASENGNIKRILFVLDGNFQNHTNSYAYVIMAGENGALGLRIPYEQ